MPVTTNLSEAAPREIVNDIEKKLKKKLIALLRDDGKGHHHAKYAERLEKFDIQVVPLSVDSNFTAAIYYDLGLIRISEGFLNDPATFFQLNVLLRHELAHSLLMHQIRMAYEVGEEAYVRTGLSKLLHTLYNIIADDEISNRKYSEEDKIVVRNMTLNGELIGGLVTEDHRKDWINLSVEEMYHKLCEEIEEIQTQIRKGRDMSEIAAEKGDDGISRSILSTYIYSDITSSSIIPGRLQAFIERGCTIAGQRWQKDYCEIATGIYETLSNYEEFSGMPLSQDELKDLLLKVAMSSPVETLDLFGDNKVVLYTPEDKYVAVEVLKKFKDAYSDWYDKVMSSLGDLSTSELQELLDLLK